METVLRRTGEGLIQLPNRYTREEFEQSWLRSDNKARLAKIATLIAPGLTQKAALEISALFVRRIHPDILCTYFDPATSALKLFTGDCDGIADSLVSADLMIRAYETSGADEGGRMFAEPGMFDIDVIGLVRTMLEAAEEMKKHNPLVAVRMEQAVAKCYLGITS